MISGIFSTDGEFHSQQRSLVRQILTEVSWDQSSKAIARIQSISEELVEWLSAVGMFLLGSLLRRQILPFYLTDVVHFRGKASRPSNLR